MISHVTVGIADFERAFAFYDPLMTRLGHRLRFKEAGSSWAGWMPAAVERPLFLITRPFDGRAAAPGNGPMTAFLASNRSMVVACYEGALVAGGLCEGPPGLRPEYHPDYFGAYVRDPDGNKLCFCCHEPASAA